MKKFWIAIAVLLVLVLGGLFAVFQWKKVSIDESAFGEGFMTNFLASFEEGCRGEFAKQSGRPQAEAQEFCHCASEATFAALKAKGPLSIAEMLELQDSPEIAEAVTPCARFLPQ